MVVAQVIWTIALTLLVLVGIFWVVDLQRKQQVLRRRLGQILAGANEDDVQMGLDLLLDRANQIKQQNAEMETRLQHIEARLPRTIQAVGLVRFRAYEDTGGDQSFALALTNAAGDGVVISALYGRGNTRVYGKPVEAWISTKQLGDEEREALAQARQFLSRG